MRSERFNFPNAKGEKLAATLDLPLGKPTAFALFAHCFTCGKDMLAAKRIAERLDRRTASPCCASTSPASAPARASSPTRISPPTSMIWSPPPIICARRIGAPAILIGHSLGGAAVLAAAHRIARGARGRDHRRARRSRARHRPVQGSTSPTIKRARRGRGALAGRPFRISANSSTTWPSRSCSDCLADLRKALLVFHSPTDDLVGIDNASRSSAPPSIRRASSRSPTPTIC